jgi:Type II CAAX prenyl endopeptidase Rce1-like
MLQYILNPQYIEPAIDAPLKEKIIALGKSYLFYLLSALFAGIIMSSVDGFVVKVLHLPSILNELMKKQTDLIAPMGKAALFVIVMLVPYIEELIFRLPLNLKRGSMNFTIIFLSFILIGGGIEKLNLGQWGSGLAFLLLITIMIIAFKYLTEEFWNSFKTTRFKYVFYTSAIIFGLVHIGNFASSDYRLWVFYPFFVLTQLSLGLFAGSLRMQYGLIWGVFLHALVNLPAVFYVIFKF